ncbi:MAG: prolyl aminopeptidase [Agitococcus sp.]|nr:prolyl aminopeptidase [Moraxellaceae bacterium]MBP9215620.1 prolyl aminopeptidase [Agitococcus sp.]HQV80057.1 prolyl aminopeptidase [Agitococcus sp.]
MLSLYPEIQPHHHFHLHVDDTHNLYVEESGNPQGIPVVFLHGGPGAGTQPWHRRFFDPTIYRIVLFDQRGAGQSTPHASLENNTTGHLVADMELIRQHLGIEQWLLFGGSWGSTLALAYAEAHTERVLGLILRGVFLCRREDLLWFYQEGASRIFPDAWEEYKKAIPVEEHHDFMAAYHKRLTGEDELAQMAAAKAWSVWEGMCSTLKPNPHVVHHFADPHTALSLARIESHFFAHDIFLQPNQLLNQAHKLKDIDGVIVHGRYDVVCPLDGAFALHKAWPRSELHIIRDAGHSAAELGIIDALVKATNDFALRLA